MFYSHSKVSLLSTLKNRNKICFQQRKITIKNKLDLEKGFLKFHKYLQYLIKKHAKNKNFILPTILIRIIPTYK